MSLRREKVSELIKEMAAEFFARESDRTSIITITRTDISSDFQNATIYFTVFPEESEKAALFFAKRKRSEFKKYARKKIKMKRIPMFDFEIDMGEKNRQQIEKLSNK
ncbi:MAG: ribosome-binding factor A [Candidatus Paceibacteria bacterium]